MIDLIERSYDIFLYAQGGFLQSTVYYYTSRGDLSAVHRGYFFCGIAEKVSCMINKSLRLILLTTRMTTYCFATRMQISVVSQIHAWMSHSTTVFCFQFLLC